MNLALKITFIRIFTIPLFLLTFLWNKNINLSNDWGKIIATLLFILAAISDYLDGVVARLYKQETVLGKLIDPIADKILVSSALVAMVELKDITFVTSWFAIIIIAREFLVTGIRLICLPQGKIIESTKFAKLKTVLQLTAIITILVFISFRVILQTYQYFDFEKKFLIFYDKIIIFLLYLALIATIASAFEYISKNWNLITPQ